PAPPEVGDYHLPLNRFLTDRLRLDQEQITAVYEQLEAACRRPWTAKQYPHLAGWLKENDKPLVVVHVAVKRSHYYSPVVPARNEKKLAHLYGAPIPHVQQCRDLGAALAARATLRAGEGRYDAARQDSLACHRLGRHVAHRASIIEHLVGIAIETMACDADLVLLDRTKLDAKTLQSYLADLQKLPPMPPLADVVDLFERFGFLE